MTQNFICPWWFIMTIIGVSMGIGIIIGYCNGPKICELSGAGLSPGTYIVKHYD